MRICVVTNGASRLQGGMFDSVRRLWQETTRELDAEIVIKAVDDEFGAEDAAAFAPARVDRYPLGRLVGSNKLGQKFYYSSKLAQSLMNEADQFDLFSLHGLWTHPAMAVWRAARNSKTPFIIHPEGMLEPYALQFSRKAKWVVARWFQDAALNAATTIRTMAPQEAENIRAYGARAPLAMIPNGVDYESFQKDANKSEWLNKHPEIRDKKTLLFLSRIHPKKGLLPLVKSLASIPTENWSEWIVIIAGPDSGGHQEEVRQLAESLGIADRIIFPGPLYGDEKLAAYRSSHAFILPSFSEGHPLVLLEAASCGLPIIYTEGCNFDELAQADGGILTKTGDILLAEGMRQLFTMSDDDRREMGERGRDLMRREYTWAAAGKKNAELCCWATGQAEPPSFVTSAGNNKF